MDTPLEPSLSIIYTCLLRFQSPAIHHCNTPKKGKILSKSRMEKKKSGKYGSKDYRKPGVPHGPGKPEFSFPQHMYIVFLILWEGFVGIFICFQHGVGVGLKEGGSYELKEVSRGSGRKDSGTRLRARFCRRTGTSEELSHHGTYGFSCPS